MLPSWLMVNVAALLALIGGGQGAPVPPQWILDRGQAFVRAEYIPNAGPPDDAFHEQLSGFPTHAVWSLRWRVPGIDVTVSGETGAILGCSTDDEAFPPMVEPGTPPLTAELAAERARALMTRLGIPAGDWRVDNTFRPANPPPTGLQRYDRWNLGFFRYENGLPSTQEYVFVIVRAVDGLVDYLSVQNLGIRVAPEGALLPEATARALAIAAFRAAGGPEGLQPLPGGFQPGYVQAVVGSPLCRPVFIYMFDLNPGPPGVDGVPRRQIISVRLDAVTGQLLSMGSGLGSFGGLKLPKVEEQPRVALVRKLVGEKALMPLARALVSASLAEVRMKPPVRIGSWRKRLPGVDLEYALAPRGDRLYWREGSAGAWSSARMAVSEGKLLARWLRSVRASPGRTAGAAR